VPRALVVDDDATLYVAVEVCLQRQIPSPDFSEMILEPGATFRPRKPFTPNAPPAALNRCLAKPIANARLAQ
jgi:hypothetical protein